MFDLRTVILGTSRARLAAICALASLSVACGAGPESEPSLDDLTSAPQAVSFACKYTGDPGCNLSHQPGQEVMPAISGNRVVWADSRSGHWAIYLHDLDSDNVVAITPPDKETILPAIDGDRIVYARLPPDPAPWELYGYDIATQTETLFSTIPRNVGLGHFSLHNERVVWHTRRDGNWDVYLHDFTTHTETRITTDPADQADPRIHGDRIVWADRRHGALWWDVYMKDLSTGVEQRITQQSTLGRGPVLSATRMVWGDIRGGFFKLYEYDFYANPHERPLQTSLVENSLAISGPFVTWVNRNDANPVFYDDVFVYDIVTEQEVRVTQLPARQWRPAIAAPYLLWEDHRKGSADVFIEQLSSLF
jgi:beta propeller repeat protein